MLMHIQLSRHVFHNKIFIVCQFETRKVWCYFMQNFKSNAFWSFLYLLIDTMVQFMYVHLYEKKINMNTNQDSMKFVFHLRALKGKNLSVSKGGFLDVIENTIVILHKELYLFVTGLSTHSNKQIMGY